MDEKIAGGVAPKEQETAWKVLFGYHFGVTFLVNTIVCLTSLILWSSLFLGHEVYEFLRGNGALSYAFLALCACIVLTLYMLDFFWPPHHSSMLALWPGDRVLGRSCLGVAMVFFVLAGLLWTGSFVSLPLLVSICFCPMAVYSAHLIHDPFKPPELSRRKTEIVECGGVEDKMRLLKAITGEERTEAMFYLAATVTFGSWFFINLMIFVFGTVLGGPTLESLTDGLNTSDRDAKYVQWASPLVMGIANLVFCMFGGLRVAVQRVYSRTDRYKNQLIADLSDSTMIQEMTEQRMKDLRRARTSEIRQLEDGSALEAKQKQYREQHTARVGQLTTILKFVVCLFVVMLGVCYLARQMLYASTHIASMVAGTMALFFLIFCVFAYISLYRVVQAMGQWLVELPAWKTFVAVLKNAWVRAAFLSPFAPFIPILILLSLANQRIRLLRGIYPLSTPSSPATTPDGPVDALRKTADYDPLVMWLTPRVYKRVEQLRAFDWLEIVPKIYALCALHFAFTICPPPLNVALAAMNRAIEQANIHYALILIAIFVIGIVCFLLPTVPGAVVYMFGGLVSAAQCPAGFWAGAIISVFLGLLMKLVGCAIQQVCIGGLLGKSLTIRQQAGVHKTAVRCIEYVLRQKGFSAGKVAILCGGPDWPTSVLAGVLGLSLVEMEIGTLPIIGFIAPFGLSGSLLLRAGENPFWTNSANLMLVSSFLVMAVLWAMAGWACQHALEKHRFDLTKPLRQNVDLEWLDYRAQYVKDQLKVQWVDVPISLRVFWMWGAMVQILVCYCFQFGGSYLVGSFQINNDLSTLSFAGWSVGNEDAPCLFSYACLVVIGMYVLAFSGHAAFSFWLQRKTREPRARALKELDNREAEWKDEYLRRCDEAERMGATPSGEKMRTEAAPSIEQPVILPAPTDAGDSQSEDLNSQCDSQTGSTKSPKTGRKRTRQERMLESSEPLPVKGE